MRVRLQQFALAALGLVALSTGLPLILIGPASIPGALPVSPSVDSELRFYAVFWLFYGGVALWCCRRVEEKGRTVRLLAAILLACGVARTISMLAAGLPHPVFVAAAIAEYVTPLILVLLQRRIEERAWKRTGMASATP